MDADGVSLALVSACPIAREGKTGVCKSLLEELKPDVNMRHKNGQTPSILVEHSANPALSGDPGVTEVTPETAAAAAKCRGDDAFKRNEYQAAVDAYTQAININPCDSTVFYKRSLSWIRVGQAEQALADAEVCRSLVRQGWAEGLFPEDSPCFRPVRTLFRRKYKKGRIVLVEEPVPLAEYEKSVEFTLRHRHQEYTPPLFPDWSHKEKALQIESHPSKRPASFQSITDNAPQTKHFKSHLPVPVNSNAIDPLQVERFPKSIDSEFISTGPPLTASLGRRKMSPPSPATKRLIIKLRSEKPMLPPSIEEDTVSRFKSAVSSIFLNQQNHYVLGQLYQDVVNTYTHKMGAKLYQVIESECEAYLSAAIQQALSRQSGDAVVFLSLVDKCWQDFCDQMLLIRRVAPQLDTAYVRRSHNTQTLWDMGLRIFRKHLSIAHQFEEKIVIDLLRLIELERMGKAVDKTLICRLFKMFSSLGIYPESFDNLFLESSSEFYESEGIKYMQILDVPFHLKQIETRLIEERDREYLKHSTKKALLISVKTQLLERHAHVIVHKGFNFLMEGKQIEDLKRMYMLLSRVDSLEIMGSALGSYIKYVGRCIIMDEEKDKDMVLSLLQFQSSLDKIWEESFFKNWAFGETIKDSLMSIFSIKQNRLAELIAKFIDDKLRAVCNGKFEEDPEDILDRVGVLLMFIQSKSKSVFQEVYEKDFAKRLLLRRSASIDKEKSMISCLKKIFCSQFTNKLGRMLQDMELSKQISESFRQWSQAQTQLTVRSEMSILVLNTEHWPKYQSIDVKIPCELAVYQKSFEEFYKSKYRRLKWQNSLGHCVLKADFPKGKKELVVSLFQAVVLKLFNYTDKLTFQDMKNSTGIEDKELRTTLHSLVYGKVQILIKEPNGKHIGDDDLFLFNESVTTPLYRIKLLINAIPMEETVQEDTTAMERVYLHRQYEIDAAIVRIMKRRKVLSYDWLTALLEQQLKFSLDANDILKRIESLIARDFIARYKSDKSNAYLYKYLT